MDVHTKGIETEDWSIFTLGDRLSVHIYIYRLHIALSSGVASFIV